MRTILHRRFLTALLIATTALLTAAAAIALEDSTIFGLVSTGEVYASTDGGITWESRDILPMSDAIGLMAGEVDTDLTLISSTGYVFRSPDAGYNWYPTDGINSSELVDVTVRMDGGLLVLDKRGSIFLSFDEGETWTILARLTSPDFVSITAMHGHKVHALTEHGQVYTSLDDGVTWAMTAALTISDAVAIRGFSETLHVLTYTGEILESVDGGHDFSRVMTLAETGMQGLALTHEGLAASTKYGSVATSLDGREWTWVGTINQIWVTALASDVTIITLSRDDPSPTQLWLGNPFPNPGSGLTMFPARLPGDGEVRLELYDVRGRCLARRSPQHIAAAGRHELSWDPGPLAAGVYFVRLVAESGRTATTKWMVLR